MSLAYSTTPAEVRAVLGVSITEIPDETLNLTVFANLATLELEDIATTLPADWATVNAVVSKTTAEQRFVNLVSLYYTYIYANLCLSQLPLFAVQSLTDGRASFSRQTDPYESVRQGISAMLKALKTRLLAAYNALYPGYTLPTESATFSTVVSTGLAIDPVTNT